MQFEVFFTIPDTFGTHHTPVLLDASASLRGILSIFKFGCSKRKQFYCASASVRGILSFFWVWLFKEETVLLRRI